MLMNQGWMTQTSMIMRVNERGQRFHALKSGRRKGPCQYDCGSMQPKIERPFYARGSL